MGNKSMRECFLCLGFLLSILILFFQSCAKTGSGMGMMDQRAMSSAAEVSTGDSKEGQTTEGSDSNGASCAFELDKTITDIANTSKALDFNGGCNCTDSSIIPKVQWRLTWVKSCNVSSTCSQYNKILDEGFVKCTDSIFAGSVDLSTFQLQVDDQYELSIKIVTNENVYKDSHFVGIRSHEPDCISSGGNWEVSNEGVELCYFLGTQCKSGWQPSGNYSTTALDGCSCAPETHFRENKPLASCTSTSTSLEKYCEAYDSCGGGCVRWEYRQVSSPGETCTAKQTEIGCSRIL